MQSTCVNSDELTKVVYLPEMKDEDYLRKLLEETKETLNGLPAKIADALTRTSSSGQPMAERKGLPRWQMLLGAFVSILVILGSFWAVLRFAIHTELADPASAANQNISVLHDSVNSLRDKDVGLLRNDMDHVKTDLGRLLDWQTKLILGPQASKGASGMRLAPEELKEMAKRARERSIPTDVGAIQVAAKPLEHSNDVASWQALLELVNLRSFVNSSLEQPAYNIIQTMHVGDHIDFESGVGKWILFEGDGKTLVLDTQKGEKDPAIIDKTANERAKIYQYFIFRNTHIVYRGNPIVLINVFFDNCTFEIRDNNNGRMLADQLLKSTYPTLTVS